MLDYLKHIYLLVLEKSAEHTVNEISTVLTLWNKSYESLKNDKITDSLGKYQLYILIFSVAILFTIYFFGMKFKSIICTLYITLLLYNIESAIQSIYAEWNKPGSNRSRSFSQSYNPGYFYSDLVSDAFGTQRLNGEETEALNQLQERFIERAGGRLRDWLLSTGINRTETEEKKAVQKVVIKFCIFFIFSLIIIYFVNSIFILIFLLTTSLGMRICYEIYFENTEYGPYIVIVASAIIAIVIFYLLSVITNLIISLIMAYSSTFLIMMLGGVLSGNKDYVEKMWLITIDYSEILAINGKYPSAYDKWLYISVGMILFSFILNSFIYRKTIWSK
ncbi:hypothetical protein NUSPORA_01249 [Nucleospora cyclopteri]